VNLHAAERSQVMSPTVTDGADWWGNGDVVGLQQVGADQGCLYAAS
jgi:hypothetical protein